MKKFLKNIASVFAVTAIFALAASAVSADTTPQKYRGEHIDYSRFVDVETGSGSF
jgi:hypothetical protein